jgi:predicted membrane GTPase involved in stress response
VLLLVDAVEADAANPLRDAEGIELGLQPVVINKVDRPRASNGW